MTTRFKAGDLKGVPSGYEGSATPDDVRIPSCGIEDVDKALFVTLRDEVKFQVSDNGGGKQLAVPMVFATGEKWSMLKSGRALRDKDGTLILPLVTVRRTAIEQSASDVAGRGMNQHVGEIVVRTKLDPSDRTYQNLINKLGVVNSDDSPGDRQYDEDNELNTVRQGTAKNALDQDVRDGALLAPKLGDNVWQVITIPTPQFFTAVYEITLWAQYTEHMNQMIEKLLSSYLPTGNRSIKLDTAKGYWFVAYFDEAIASDDNSDNSSGVELVRKCKITVRVPGYLVLSSAPGVPNGVRKYVSAPQVVFAFGGENVDTTLTQGIPDENDPYESADDPDRQYLLSDMSQHPTTRIGDIKTRAVVNVVSNPFTGRKELEYAKVVHRNPSTGETVLTPEDGLNLSIISNK